MTAVWERSTARGKHLLVLLALADWADDSGWCYPSYASVAKKSRMSRTLAVKLVDELEAAGELGVKPRGHLVATEGEQGIGNFQATNLYQIKVVTPGEHHRKHKVVQKDAKGGHKVVTPGGQDPSLLDPSSLEPSLGKVFTGGWQRKPKEKKPSVHEKHAWCGDRFCVWSWQHEDFVQRLGGYLALMDLPGFYAKVCADIGDAPVPEKFSTYLEKQFSEALKQEVGA